MVFKYFSGVEALVTVFTREFVLPSVMRLMRIVAEFGHEAFATNTTLILQPFVTPHMVFEIRVIIKAPPADLAVETELAGVDLHMSLQMMLVHVDAVAFWTREHF